MSPLTRASRTGHRWSAAERKALSAALRGKHRTAAQRAAESKRLKGRKHKHKGHKLSARERAALARGRRLAHLHHHKLTAKQKAAMARGRALAKARAKAHRLSAKQLAALARARHRKHTAAQKAAESARMRGKHHKPPRGQRLHHRNQAGHHEQQHRGKRSGRVVAPAARTRRVYPSKFGAVHHRPKSRFVRGRAVRTVHAPFVRGRHHIKSWKG